MWTDRRTDMTKLVVAFQNFADVPKILIWQADKKRPTVESQLWVAGCFEMYLKH